MAQRPRGEGSDALKAIMAAIKANPEAADDIIENAGSMFDSIPGFRALVKGVASDAPVAAKSVKSRAKSAKDLMKLPPPVAGTAVAEAAPQAVKGASKTAAMSAKEAKKHAAILKTMDNIEAHTGVRPTYEFASLPRAERKAINVATGASKRAQANDLRANAALEKSAANKAAHAGDATEAEKARRKAAKDAYWAREKELNSPKYQKAQEKKNKGKK